MNGIFQTEYEFELPVGYVDNNGNLHKRGTMRLARAIDEIVPLKDIRVQQNEAYLTIIILTRVIVKLGAMSSLDTHIIENLFSTDLRYLQDFYQRINGTEEIYYSYRCPHCNETIKLPMDFFLQRQ